MTFDPFDARGTFVPAEALQRDDEQCSLSGAEPRRSVIGGVLILAALAGAFIMGGIVL